MKRRLFIAKGLILGSFLILPVIATAAGLQKEAKPPAAKQDRIDGTVQEINTTTKTISVRLRGKNVFRQVIYDDKTEFTFRNKPGKLDDVKDGRRVIVLGKHNDKLQLMAARIDVRDENPK